jgi:hypothetical protein
MGEGILFMLRFLLLLTVSAATSLAADLLPLENGNTWTYRVATTGETLTIRVGTPYLIGERVYYTLNGFADKRVLARVDDDALWMIDEEAGVERLLVDFRPYEGGWWNANGRMCDTMGQTQTKRAEYRGGAGRIPEVLAIQYRTLGCADTGVLSEQYAENIGMLRRTVQSFTGPRTYDLVSARVGNLRIEASPHGRFTTSIERVTADSIEVKLHIELDPVQSITLPFYSGQEYDVALRNEDGNVVYLWSSTAAFIQSTHTLTIAGDWTAKVTIPKPVAGSYTLEAWMTTALDRPRFSASIPLVLKAE